MVTVKAVSIKYQEKERREIVGQYSLFAFMDRIIKTLLSEGKVRTSETYSAALKSFRQFRGGKDIMLDCLNVNVMKDFAEWHYDKGNTSNTVSFYARILRAVYNRAVDMELIEDRRPFRHIYTGVAKTRKRALPIEVIKRIRMLDLSCSPPLEFARDMFMLSFYLRGMSFVDMALLRKRDLSGGYLVYRRRKTGAQMKIKWTVEMQTILKKYPGVNGYLLSVLTDEGNVNYLNYRRVGYKINVNLKKIAARVGLSAPLTLYVARHSWASIAKQQGVPIGVISEGMGHRSEATTQIYLASLDVTVVDKANDKILKSLR